ncbi:MAG TPA: SPW repeat protein [Candidatus Saccharimonadales bacterium]|nr:SPW repeat protein [Candidatus Saccharimonadales bacterium]
MEITDVEDQAQLAQARSLSTINFLIGLWLVAAPFALGYTTSVAYWSEIVTGALIALFSLAHLASPRMNSASWFNSVAGIWLIISPFILGYIAAAAYWNEIIFGIVVTVLSFSNVGTVSHRTHHQT